MQVIERIRAGGLLFRRTVERENDERRALRRARDDASAKKHSSFCFTSVAEYFPSRSDVPSSSGRLERPLAESPSSTGLDEPAGACDRTHSAGSRLEAVARAPSLPKPRTRGSADRRARSGSRVLDRRALVASFVRPSRPTPRARCPPRRRTRPPPTLTKSHSPSFRKHAPSTTSFSSVLLFLII